MNEKLKYIVQYVGFTTAMNPDEFVKRWTPFAAGFKNAGIKTIDLYQVRDDEKLTFISRNVWEEKIYFANFPSGIAGAGSGGGISVTQLGGYWLEEEDLVRPDQMNLAFLTTDAEISTASQIARRACTEHIPNKQMLECTISNASNFPSQLICTHIKQM